MGQKRDFYEVLGVARDAAGDDIRKAYRASALKNHPDRNPGDASAEGRFKEATEAYSVLSDDEKRRAYDQFGHAGLEGRGGFDFSGAGIGDIFTHFQDVFSDFFGFAGMGGTGGRQKRSPERGRDVRVDAQISLANAMTGCKEEVSLRGAAPCGDCNGSGAATGTKPERCPQCSGTGQQTTQRGFIMFSTTCARCRGTGQYIASPCKGCSGAGLVEKSRKVLVTFPMGIDSGQRLRVPGQGMPGPANSPPGDLYVDVELEPHERFERRGSDLATRVRVSFTHAALGGEVELELPTGDAVTVGVSPGTQPGAVISLRGKGVPLLNGQGRGALHAVIDVEVPTRLSRRAKKLLRELQEELGEAGSTVEAG